MAKRKDPVLQPTRPPEENPWKDDEVLPPPVELPKELVVELGVTTKPVSTPKPKPKHDPDAVSLRIFITACGKAYNQTAGFQSYAVREGLKPRPMKAWHEAFESFLNRPVNGG